MKVEAAERALYTDVWQGLDRYGDVSPGERYFDAFLDMATPKLPAAVLDAGAGSGKGAVILARNGFKVHCCDLVPDGLVEEARDFPFTPVCLWRKFWRQTGMFDFVYCCDVLEHIPTPFTMLVVSRLLEAAKDGVFLSISLTPDMFGEMVGKPLHQTVQSFVTWRDQLAELGTLRESRDLLHTGLFYLEPRRG